MTTCRIIPRPAASPPTAASAPACTIARANTRLFPASCPCSTWTRWPAWVSSPRITWDITAQIDTKIRALECHESQLKWMFEHDGIDFADMVRTCSKYRGYQCGVAYAEGFKPYNVYPRYSTRNLLPGLTPASRLAAGPSLFAAGRLQYFSPFLSIWKAKARPACKKRTYLHGSESSAALTCIDLLLFRK